MSQMFLFITDPLENIRTQKDTTVAIYEEARNRGIACYFCQPEDIFIFRGKTHVSAAQIFLDDSNAILKYSEPKSSYSIDDFSVAFMRKDPPVDNFFLTSLMMLRAYDKEKTLFINEPNGLLIANEKIFGLDIIPNFMPKTLVSKNPDTIKNFIREEKKVVLKPISKARGEGILVFQETDKNLNSALSMMLEHENNYIIAQRYLEAVSHGDKRILLLGGEPVGAILRTASENDNRANLTYGGMAEKCEVSHHEAQMIKELKPHLLAHGLHLVGLDVIGEYITEVNVTSPTGLRQMEEFGNHSLRSKILDYFIKLAPKRL